MMIIAPIHSPCPSSSRRSGIRDGYKAGWDLRCVLSILGDLLRYPIDSQPPHPTHTMSSHWKQSSTYYHYMPSTQSYYVQRTLPAVSSSSSWLGTQHYPQPQVRAAPPSKDGNVKSLGPIKPVPTTTSAKDSTSPPGKKTSSSKKDSSGKKQYKFVPYSPR